MLHRATTGPSGRPGCFAGSRRPCHALCTHSRRPFPAAGASVQAAADTSAAPLDVAIVGAGPAGAAAASSILTTSPHLRVQVFERATQLQPFGFCVHLHGNGFSALEAIDPRLRGAVQDLLLPDGAIASHFSDGRQIATAPSLFGRYPGANGLMLWHELQSALLQRLPDGTLQPGHTLDTLSTTPDLVTLHFRDHPPVSAKVVIGSDGYNSTVRRHVLGTPGMALQRVGASVCRGIALAPPSWPHHANVATSWVSLPQKANMLMVRLRVGRVWWDLLVVQEDAGGQLQERRYSKGPPGSGPATAAKLQQVVAELGKAWPEDMLEVVRATDPVTLREFRLSVREVEDCQVWGQGRLTLAGDAAHLGSLAQNVNQALEDAVELGRAIGELGATEEALRRYESVRQPRALRVQAETVALVQSIIGGKPSSESAWNEQNRWCIEHELAPLPRPAA